jgi:hypothetical protein
MFKSPGKGPHFQRRRRHMIPKEVGTELFRVSPVLNFQYDLPLHERRELSEAVYSDSGTVCFWGDVVWCSQERQKMFERQQKFPPLSYNPGNSNKTGQPLCYMPFISVVSIGALVLVSNIDYQKVSQHNVFSSNLLYNSFNILIG